MFISSGLARICIINMMAPVHFVTFQTDSVQLTDIYIHIWYLYTHTSHACTTAYEPIFLFKYEDNFISTPKRDEQDSYKKIMLF